MGRKYTTEYVKQYFINQGCELLEEEYKHPHIPMKYRCHCGKEATIRWWNFLSGSRCAKCSGTEKPTYDYVLKFFEDNGCELLEKEYVNAHSKMKFRCKCGKVSEAPWMWFKKSKQCSRCGGTGKPTQEEVFEEFKKHGCILLSEYKNNITPMNFICKCCKQDEITYKTFKKSHQCARCSGKKKYTFDEVKCFFEYNKCILLEKEYINNSTKMKYLCKCGQQSIITFDKFKTGGRCKECAIKRGINHSRWNPDREFVEINKEIAVKSNHLLRRMMKNEITEITNINKMKDILGYTMYELRDHITSHANWNDIKDGEWHIDHIFPVKAFTEHGIQDLKLINSLDNLQPLSKKENLSKQGKYDKSKFFEWLSKKYK